MRERLPALLAGLLFGGGLLISGMADPQRVLAFLRIAAGWDPSLAFVMGGALAVTLPGFALLKRRTRPLFADVFASPPMFPINRRLLAGAALFGLGWGWVGYCPGPALVGFGLGHWTAWLFVPAMLIGGAATARLLRN